MTRVAALSGAVRRTLWPLAVVAGLATLVVVHEHPDFSRAEDSIWGAAGVLVPGWALAAVGLLTWARRPSSRSGPLLAAAGISWFVADWNNPGIGWAPVFTVGLIGYALCPVIVASAVLTFPNGRASSPAERLIVAVAYANSLLVLGVLPALTFGPAAEGCTQCPQNLLHVVDAPGVQDRATRAGIGLGAVCFLTLGALVIRQLLRSSSALRRLKGPVSVSGACYLGFVAADYAHQLARPVRGIDEWDRRLWLAQSGALLALAVGVTLGPFRGRRTRSSIARLVVDLASAPPTGGLRDALAEVLGDDSLQLAYPVSGAGLVDARGSPLTDDRPATALVRSGRQMAVLTHRPGLLDDPVTAEEVARAARLVLDNERLQAELSAQLTRLRESRQRIVAAGDAERRRLERDLHDGAQQRLVTLLLQLRLERGRWGVDAQASMATHAVEVETELEGAIEDLRELAHGIFPAVLADEGLAQAVEAFAEGAQVPVVFTSLDDVRLNRTIEGVAYSLVAESVTRTSARQATVSITCRPDLLCVDVDLDDVRAVGDERWVRDIEDRVGAVGGRLDVSRARTGRLRVRAEIPCAS